MRLSRIERSSRQVVQSMTSWIQDRLPILFMLVWTLFEKMRLVLSRNSFRRSKRLLKRLLTTSPSVLLCFMLYIHCLDSTYLLIFAICISIVNCSITFLLKVINMCLISLGLNSYWLIQSLTAITCKHPSKELPLSTLCLNRFDWISWFLSDVFSIALWIWLSQRIC